MYSAILALSLFGFFCFIALDAGREAALSLEGIRYLEKLIFFEGIKRI